MKMYEYSEDDSGIWYPHVDDDTDTWEYRIRMVLEPGDQVDVTDPCYDKDVWCRFTTDLDPGEYRLMYDKRDEGAWGVRISSVRMVKASAPLRHLAYHKIGEIGVDAGLAGFFVNKPDYDDKAWAALCDAMGAVDKAWEAETGEAYRNVYEFDSGFFVSSGYGDGCYDVYELLDEDSVKVGLEIVFIDDEEYEEEEEEEEEDEEED